MFGFFFAELEDRGDDDLVLCLVVVESLLDRVMSFILPSSIHDDGCVVDGD